GQECPPTARRTHHRKIVLGGTYVGNVKRTVLAQPAVLRFVHTDLVAVDWHGTKMSLRNKATSLPKSQHHVINPTNPSGALDDGIKHRLHVCGRATDDPQHLTRRLLVLQSLPQFCIALLDLLEQPHVLDGDHRLIREGFQERDLFFREGTNLHTADHDRPDRDILPQQRCSKKSTDAVLLS